MPRAKGTSGDLEDLPLYFRRAHGVDEEWKSQGICRQHDAIPGFFWRTDPRERKVRVADGVLLDGRQIEKVAEDACATCPVQWDCTAYAVIVGEIVGTWGVKLATLTQMKREPEAALALIRRAKARQVTVRQAWRERTLPNM